MNANPLNIDSARRRYRALIGTGGIGSGRFFAISGNETLGREESRSGRFVDRRDYCKLHIIAHYVRALMGPDFAVRPLGKVGDDEIGRELLDEMRAAGLDLRHVRAVAGEQTMYCICLIYPDGGGGNLTIEDSACAKVDAPFIRAAEGDFAAFADEAIALAAPEAPLEARAELLELATRHGLFRAASFTSRELPEARARGMLEMIDLLALNIDEAAALARLPRGRAPSAVAQAAVEALREIRPQMLVSVTAGAKGSWVWDGRSLTHEPGRAVKVAGAAGAGDAHFAGILAGLAAGLNPGEAHELGALVATMSVTSPHTIHKGIDRDSLRAFAGTLQRPPGPAVSELLEA